MFPNNIINMVADKSQHRCVYCGSVMNGGSDCVVDRILPDNTRNSRNTDMRNFVLACRKCNLTKGSKVYSPDEFDKTFATDKQKQDYREFYSEHQDSANTICSAKATSLFSSM